MLPFEKAPLCTAYHSNAFPLGIIQGNFQEDIIPWLCGRYVNCQYVNSMAKNKFDICISDNWFTVENILKHRSIALDWEQYGLLHIDVLKIVQNMLMNQYYVCGLYDEMYIPGKTAYQTYSYIHDYILIGFDDNKKVFFSAGYLSNGMFEIYEIPYECYYQSLAACKAGKTSLDFYQYNADNRLPFNMLRVYRGLNDYLHSKNHETTVYKGRVYGMDAVRQLQLLFARTWQQERYVDSRYTRLLLEHKYLMAKRMHYLYTEKYISDAAMTEKSDKVLRYAQQIHLLGIKANMVNRTEIVDRIVEYIEEILEQEQEYLRVVVDTTHGIVSEYFRTHRG